MKQKNTEPESLKQRLAELEAENAALRARLAGCDLAADKYRFLADASLDPMSLINADHVYEAANQAHLDALGLEREQVVGRHLAEVWGARTHETVLAGHMASCLAGNEVTYEADFSFDGEQERIYEVTWRPYPTADRPTHVAVSSHDITKYRAAQAEAEKNRELYTLLAENTADLVWIMNCDGEFTYYSPSVRRILGFTPREVMAMPLWRRFPPRDHERLLQALDEHNPAAGGSRTAPGRYEFSQYTRHGCIINTEAIISPLFSADGRPLGVMGVSRDITARKLAEEALKTSESKYRAIFENIPDVYYEIDLEGTLLEVSPSVTHLGGYLREEILGESFARFYADPDERRQFVRTILAQGSVADYELRFLDKSGRERQLSANAVLTGEDGDLRIAGLLRDIGDRKAMETGLAEARRRADKASQAKSEFLARMSHELRTPLSGILGVTDLLLSMIADEEQRHLLGLLRETNELMMAVVGDLLDLSRIEAGHLELAPEPVDVRALALSILAMFSHHVQGRDLELDFRFDEGLPPHLVVDPVRLRQVLVNLVGNAVKYTSAGSVLLEITDLGPSGDAARNVEFRVADTGCGVPEAMRERIFDSYARLPENSTDAPGTGLGLTIVRELVELMGSTVKVTDRDPRGSVFSFCLALEPAGPSRREQSGTPPELAPLNLLLAEDDRINQFFTRKLLERMGHRVDVAGTGVEALEYLAAGSYDCVLMDIQMPDMDGVEATRRIRSGELSGVDPGVPVVAVTAFALEEDSRRFLEAGMNASIPKPLDVNALVRTLKRSITSNIEENH